MTMLEIHSAAIDENVSSYHEFLQRFSKTAKVVYGFVEGKDDPNFYQGFIESQIPEDWDLELWPAGGKHQVYIIHRAIDWRRFPKARICFFVDKDLSDIVPEKLSKDSNIYVTTGYSIENDVVNKRVCLRTLVELCGFSKVNRDELDEVGLAFDRALGSFVENMVVPMSWILCWRRVGRRANLNDISMNDMFLFENAGIRVKPVLGDRDKISKYMHEKCNVPFDPAVDIDKYINEFKASGGLKRNTRGKFIFWLLVEFCNSIHRDAVAIFSGIVKRPKKNVTMSSSNAIALIGPRARMPISLRKFIESTFCTYINHVQARSRL